MARLLCVETKYARVNINKRIYLGQGRLVVRQYTHQPTSTDRSSFVQFPNEKGSQNTADKFSRKKEFLKDCYFIFRRIFLEKPSVIS